MAKRLDVSEVSGQERFRISHPGFDVRTCDLDSPVETAFNSDWDQKFLQLLYRGSFSLSDSEDGTNDVGKGTIENTSIVVPALNEPTYFLLTPRVGNKRYDIRICKTYEPAGASYRSSLFAGLRTDMSLYVRYVLVQQRWSGDKDGYRRTGNVYDSATIDVDYYAFRMDYDGAPSW